MSAEVKGCPVNALEVMVVKTDTGWKSQGLYRCPKVGCNYRALAAINGNSEGEVRGALDREVEKIFSSCTNKS